MGNKNDGDVDGTGTGHAGTEWDETCGMGSGWGLFPSPCWSRVREVGVRVGYVHCSLHNPPSHPHNSVLSCAQQREYVSCFKTNVFCSWRFY